MSILTDLRFALRSLSRVKGLALTVIVTLALGIGANAAIFSVVRGVLLRPLVNRDEARLIYIRQSAPGIGTDNTAFSVPEIQDLKDRVKSINAFGDFSTIGFTMVGLGEPRVVRAGVVGGSYFDVMGLKPVIGRLIGPTDDGPNAAGVAVLTYRFWTTDLEQRSDRARKDDPARRALGDGHRRARAVGALSGGDGDHRQRRHQPASSLRDDGDGTRAPDDGAVRPARAWGRRSTARKGELRGIHASMVKAHPEAYSPKADFRIDAVQLRDQITSPARTVLLVLLAASGLIFVIACSNVANLILARSVRREGELAIRAALGAGTGALRRTLLAESLVLCGAGAIVGVLVARPMVAILARYASRFSVRALDLTVDSTLLWVGVVLAIAAAVLLAFVPRLPSADATTGIGLSSGGTCGSRRAPTAGCALFAVTQIAASFVLLAGAGMLLTTLFALQQTRTGFDMEHVLAIDVPIVSYERKPQEIVGFYKEVMRRIEALPGVERVAVGTVVPWRDKGIFGPGFQFSVQGYTRANGEEDPRGRFRTVSPGFFAALGVPIVAGRDFTEADRSRRREGRDRQPEPRAADVPHAGCAQPLLHVDRSGDAVRRRQHRPAPHRRHRRGYRRRGCRARSGDEHLPAVRSGDRRRPAVRAHEDEPIRAGGADHADHPVAICRAAGREGRDASRTSARKCWRPIG